MGTVQCCHQDVPQQGGRLATELQLQDEYLDDGMARVNVQEVPFEAHHPGTWNLCKANNEDEDPQVVVHGAMLESLSYTPDRFDESTTIDVERSHARYSKIVVHSTHARTQRRSKAWEDWLRGATSGRPVTLLEGFEGGHAELPREGAREPQPSWNKLPAMYYLDRALSTLSIQPNDSSKSSAITLLIDNIQVICPVSDFMLFFEQIETNLDESEKARAVLLQYTTEDTERKRVCFLEESEHSKERFVQALTALWLEKRNDHSMWF